MKYFKFNGETRDYIRVLRGSKRPAWAPIRRELLNVDGADGVFLSSTETDTREISIPIKVKGTDIANLQKLKEDLAGWLVTNEVKVLTFDDEPDRIYYALIDDTLDLDEIVHYGKGIIKFICPDAYKYGPQKKVLFQSSGVFDVDGSANAEPIIRVEMKDNATFVAVSDVDGNINMIGDTAPVGANTYSPKTVILNDSLNTTVGWGVGGFALDGGVITGKMDSDGDRFYASDYGSGSEWHGPALVKSLAEVLQDFEIEFTFYFHAPSAEEIGRIEIYGLDPSNKKIFRMTMRDNVIGSDVALPEGVIFDNNEQRKYVLVRNAADVWQNFYGYMRISRVGRDIEFFLKKVDQTTGKTIDTKTRRYWDSTGLFQGQLASIGVHVGTYGTHKSVATCKASHVAVSKINNKQDGTPYIVKAGDVVEFNHVTNKITINNEDAMKEKAFIGEYFDLKKGRNAIAAEPASAIAATEVRWRDRWL